MVVSRIEARPPGLVFLCDWRWCAINERQLKIVQELAKKAIELMAEWPPSREKQRQFVLSYLANGFQNATEAARQAGSTERSAKKYAHKLRTSADFSHVQEVIAELKRLFDERSTELSIMTAVELQQFWARVIRGEEKDVKLVGVGEGEQEVMEVPADLSVRLSASDKYAKALGMYQNNVNATITGDITFEIGAWDDDG